MSQAIVKAGLCMDELTNEIERVISSTQMDFSKASNESMIRWKVTSDNLIGCNVYFKVVDEGYSITIDPFVETRFGEENSVPRKISCIGSASLVAKWFQKNFIYTMYVIHGFKNIVDRIIDVAKDVGFDGICLPAKVISYDEAPVDFYSHSFDFEDSYNGIRKTFNFVVSIVKSQIVIISYVDNEKKEAVFKGKDWKEGLECVRNQFRKYLGQYDPDPRYYLTLLHKPKAYGENIAVFPANRIELN